MISQRARYSFKALLALARVPTGESLQIKTIAERECVPRSFLEHIMLDLKRHQLVASRRGKNGGYYLTRPATDITLGDVLRLIDGPIAALPCLSNEGGERCQDCRDQSACALRHAFNEVQKATLAVVDRISLARAIEQADKVDCGQPVYGAHPFSGAFI